jgi:hypothetical protein
MSLVHAPLSVAGVSLAPLFGSFKNSESPIGDYQAHGIPTWNDLDQMKMHEQQGGSRFTDLVGRERRSTCSEKLRGIIKGKTSDT